MISERPAGIWRVALRRLLRNRAAVASAAVLALLVCAAFLGPLALPHSHDTQALEAICEGPSARHWLGTDGLGRDFLARLLYGARVSISIGLVATFVSVLIGVTVGAVAGYCGGAVDTLAMRTVDLLYGIPYMFVVILIVSMLREPDPMTNVVVLFAALGAVQWLTMSRIVRGQVLTLREREFVEAARCYGARPLRILFRHIVPNLLGPVTVYAALTVPQVILEESFLSFLGLGVQPPGASWGSLAYDGAVAMRDYPRLLVVPGSCLAAALLAFLTLGDALRDAFDPQHTR